MRSWSINIFEQDNNDASMKDMVHRIKKLSKYESIDSHRWGPYFGFKLDFHAHV